MRLALAAPAMAAVLACSSTPSAPSAQVPSSQPVRVLMLTATAGFRHDSIGAAREAMTQLAGQTRTFTVTATEDLKTITAATLGSTDVLMFALTSGELAFDAAQKDAIAAFVQNGGGFIGVHSATDTLYNWPEYGRIVGAYFKEHPWTQEAAVRIEDAAHPISSGVPASFRLLEEFYTFRQNPRPSVHVLLSLDPASVGAAGDFPLAWTQTVGRGRSYYNALGHFDSTWRDARFQRQLTNAIAWTAGRQ
jgi:type 1 glutamine amidotransferase